MFDHLKNKKHIMIDLETLDTRPTAAVVEIGAVAFDFDGILKDADGKPKMYSCHVNAFDEISRGFTVDEQTLDFWRDNRKQARSIVENNKAVDTSTAFGDFLRFIYSLNINNEDDVVIWSNGIAFDLPILEAHFKDTALPIMWHYYNAMDYRTVVKMFGDRIVWANRPEHEKHIAVLDAKYQVEVLLEILKSL